MALHPLKLPKSAALLFRIVVLQKRLLKALADPVLDANVVNTAWVQKVWSGLDAEWVRKFCLGGQEARIQAIAAAAPGARQGLYDEFCRQNKVRTLLNGGGDFQDLTDLQDVDAALAKQVAGFFKGCYKCLSHNKTNKWPGYSFGGDRTICNRDYKDVFCSTYPTSIVCPYCDGEIGTPELDHYLSKTGFPLLACSPWNLVPVCGSCNDVVTGKADRPAITLGSPRSTDDWLHPFFRPASSQVHIKLSGTPKSSIPQLHSTDATEQIRLDNHTHLIRTLSKRWTNSASSYYDSLVRNAKRASKPSKPIDDVVRDQLDAHLEDRGRCASSMIKAAVCQAVLDRRPEYIEEFDDPNAVALD